MEVENKLRITLDSYWVVVNNLEDTFLENCLISVTNNFGKDIIFESFNLREYESRGFTLFYDNFAKDWIKEKLTVRIYNNHNLIYTKIFNNNQRCFLLLSDKNYEALTEQLIIGLTRYTNEDIYYYTIDFNSELEYKNLYKIRYDLNLSDSLFNRAQYIQFIKSKVFLDILNRGFNHVVFLDSDIQVVPNIKNIFNYYPNKGPILQKHIWEYTLVHGEYIPGPLVRKYLYIPENNQKYPQGITNVVIFNQTHKSLFERWEKICFSTEIGEALKYEFLHDELLLNCLMWKNDAVPQLVNFTVNILNSNEANFILNFKFDGYKQEINLNELNMGHNQMSYFYYNFEEELMGFHAIKDELEAHQVNECILNNNKQNV
jgi:hypothetical protein